MNIALPSLTDSRFEITYDSKRCVIKSDPRVFWGAIKKISTTWGKLR
jgi:hypothetical protein